MKLVLHFSLVFFMLIGFNSFAQQPVVTQNTSSPAACDGSAMLDSTIVATNIVWMGGGAIIQQGGTYVGNLCAGTYIVTYSTALGITTNYTFIIGSGNTNPCSGFAVAVTGTDASNSSTCDGSAITTVTGGTSPYAYQWSNAVSVANPTALCVGTYSVCVTDVNGCMTCENVTIADASAQMDSLLIFNNNNFPGTPVIGTLATASVEDCTIDYQNVGSASVTSSTLIGTDTLMVTWTLWDTTGLIVATYTLPYFVPANANGLYSLSLVVFCSQKSTNYNTIEINDHVMLSSNALAAIDDTMMTVVNPMDNQLSIQFKAPVTGELLLFNLAGKEVMKSQLISAVKMSYDVSNLAAGTYVLQTKLNGRISYTKLIK